MKHTYQVFWHITYYYTQTLLSISLLLCTHNFKKTTVGILVLVRKYNAIYDIDF